MRLTGAGLEETLCCIVNGKLKSFVNKESSRLRFYFEGIYEASFISWKKYFVVLVNIFLFKVSCGPHTHRFKYLSFLLLQNNTHNTHNSLLYSPPGLRQFVPGESVRERGRERVASGVHRSASAGARQGIGQVEEYSPGDVRPG